ncbi:MAG: hypothetical protein WC869_10610 [Phycisphaerae bacterium]|jgi:hypothetical protein
MNLKPGLINILGKTYTVSYVERPSDVDIHGYKSLWGQVDHWTHSIRIYAPAGFEIVEILDSILHECIHVVAVELKIEALTDNEEAVGLLGMALADLLTRNGWITLDEESAHGEDAGH